MKKQPVRVLVRNFLVELIVYGILVVAYFLAALRLLSEPLTRLFHNNLVVYAFVALGLIVAQGAFLDAVTSFLLNWLRLDRLE